MGGTRWWTRPSRPTRPGCRAEVPPLENRLLPSLKLARLSIPLCLVATLGHPQLPARGSQELPGPSDALLDRTLRPLRSRDTGAALPFDSREAPFFLRVRGDPVLFRVFFLPALPGEVVTLEVDPNDTRPVFRYSAGTAVASHEEGWEWKAPSEPGTYALRFAVDGDAADVSLNIFVLHPRSSVKSGKLNGYNIGYYEPVPLRGDSVYAPPPGFIEVRPEDEDILVSPHFTLGQFVCKQPGNPKYMALSRYLVAKLEVLLQETNRAGFSASTFHVMSGFRTPAYNLAIGNRTVYSRHLWGGAADIFLDTDGDGNMDDLNGDGRSTIDDARILQDIADRVDRAENPGTRPGGLGSYRRNSVRGPFIHVDARGRLARW
jgi:hypothetical protein